MDIYFNDYKLPNVISCQVKRAARNTKTEYNAEGGMLIDMVNRKRSLRGYTVKDGMKILEITSKARTIAV